MNLQFELRNFLSWLEAEDGKYISPNQKEEHIRSSLKHRLSTSFIANVSKVQLN